MEPTERSEEFITIRDLDANQIIRIGKRKDIYIDENESMHIEASEDYILTDGHIIRSIEDFGPQCGKNGCTTLLSSDYHECHRCEIPLCKRHAKKFRGSEIRYCRSCRRIETLKAVFWWFIFLLRFKRRKRDE